MSKSRLCEFEIAMNAVEIASFKLEVTLNKLKLKRENLTSRMLKSKSPFQLKCKLHDLTCNSPSPL